MFTATKSGQVWSCVIVITIFTGLLPCSHMSALNSPISFQRLSRKENTTSAAVTLPFERRNPQTSLRRDEEEKGAEQGISGVVSESLLLLGDDDTNNTNNNNNTEDDKLQQQQSHQQQQEQQQHQMYPNDSCWMGISCDDFSTLAPPPSDVMSLVPPPPLPLFLFEMELVEQRNRDLNEWQNEVTKLNFKNLYVLDKKEGDDDARENIVFRIDPKWLSVEHVQGCSLCEWAKQNTTQPLFAKRKPFKVGASEGNIWNEALIAVALLSALIGAAFTCAIVKIKRMERLKTLPTSEDCKPCEVTQAVTNDPSQPDHRPRKEPSTDPSQKPNNQLDQQWTLNLSKTVGQQYLPANAGLEDELYINANASSVDYSELANAGCHLVSRNPNNIYSDASVPTCSHLCGIVYDNESFVIPKCPSFLSDPCCSVSSPSASSSSAPSSAYYSDVSICEVQLNKRKKHRRKYDVNADNGQVENSTVAYCVHSIPNNVQFLPNCVQNMSHEKADIPNRTQSTQNCMQHVPNTSQSDQNIPTSGPHCVQSLPTCVQALPSCVQYLPNFMILNSNHPNPDPHFLPAPDPTPVLYKHFDPHAATLPQNNDITPQIHPNLLVAPSVGDQIAPSLHYHVSEHCSRRSLDPKHNSIYEEANGDPSPFVVSCEQRTTDARNNDYEMYRGYSSSEVPSEYI